MVLKLLWFSGKILSFIDYDDFAGQIVTYGTIIDNAYKSLVRVHKPLRHLVEKGFKYEQLRRPLIVVGVGSLKFYTIMEQFLAYNLADICKN